MPRSLAQESPRAGAGPARSPGFREDGRTGRSKREGIERPKMDPTLCNYGLLRKASRRVSLAYDRILAPSGLTTAQFAILAEIAESDNADGPTMAALADALAMDRAALTQSLKPLIAGKLVLVGSDPRDRRARRATLSPFGKKRLEEAGQFWSHAQSLFSKDFGEDESVALRALLRLVVARLNPPALPKRAGR